MDQLFAAGFVPELYKRLPPALERKLASLVDTYGFDTFCCGLFMSDAAMEFLALACHEAMKAVGQSPDRVADVKRFIYSKVKLTDGRKS